MRGFHSATWTATAACLLLASGSVKAGNFGSDLNLTLTPSTGAMAGAGYARPQDPVAAVFGNPATLGQLTSSTAFTFGAAYMYVHAHANHDGSVAGAPFSANSDARNYFLPTIAVEQRVNDKLVLGGGLQAISGLGADFRNKTPIGPVVTLIVFGANAAASYEITPRLTIGASATVAYGLLELGLVSDTGLTMAFGVRGSTGATYDTGPAILSLSYTSPLHLNFRNVIETSPGRFSNFALQQPQEVRFGVASSPRIWKRLVLETDVIWKNWGNAEAYRDIWRNQTIVAVGAQYTAGRWKVRTGYSHSSDLQKHNVGSSIGSINSLAFGTNTIPVTPAVVQFVQATLTQPYWQQQVSAGLGYELTQNVGADFQVGYAFDGARKIGGTYLNVHEFQTGLALTWTF